MRRARPRADRQLQRSSITARNMGALCHSDLWDVLPQALSRASGRPLHVVSGDAREGRRIDLRSVSEAGAAHKGAGPIRRIRSVHEYNCTHDGLARAVPCAHRVHASSARAPHSPLADCRTASLLFGSLPPQSRQRRSCLPLPPGTTRAPPPADLLCFALQRPPVPARYGSRPAASALSGYGGFTFEGTRRRRSPTPAVLSSDAPPCASCHASLRGCAPALPPRTVRAAACAPPSGSVRR